MKDYFFNFFIWWYLYFFKNYFLYARFQIAYIFMLTNTYPMLKYFFAPLFGDKSAWGRFIGIFIRFWWIIFGGLISVIYSLLFLFIAFTILIAPLIPFIQIVNFLAN